MPATNVVPFAGDVGDLRLVLVEVEAAVEGEWRARAVAEVVTARLRGGLGVGRWDHR